MISYDEALAATLRESNPLGAEDCKLADACGRFLARPFYALQPMPRFTNSAMDGFGITSEDAARSVRRVPLRLRLMGEARAGGPPGPAIVPGQAARVLTGAAIPPGVGAVVVREECLCEDGEVEVRHRVRAGDNIRVRGEEYERGALLLPKGRLLGPAEIAVIASQGYGSVGTGRLPRVAVVSTGDELVPAGRALRGGSVYDSNQPGLCAALAALGLHARSLRLADRLGQARRKLSQLLETSDVLLIAGGLASGEYDVAKQALEDVGVSRRFWQVAMKPGKPTYLGVYSPPKADGPGAPVRCLVFGLPGNPVAVLVVFQLLVRPALLRLMGGVDERTPVHAKLTRGLQNKAGRLAWLRAKLLLRDSGYMAQPVRLQGSHMLLGMAGAGCLLRVEAGASNLKRGDPVAAYPVRWGLP